MELTDFVSIFEQESPLVKEPTSLNELSDILGKKCSSIRQAIDVLQENIRDLVETTQKTANKKSHIDIVVTNFWVMQLCTQQPAQHIITALTTLQSFLNSSEHIYLKPYEDPAWCKAFAYLKTIHILQPPTESLYEKWPKEKTYAYALRNLQEKGLKWSFSGIETISIQNPDHIAWQIHHLIKELGGCLFIQCMLSELSYCKEAHRFLLNRQGNSSVLTQWELDTPTNYMLNMGIRCVKYPSQCKKEEVPEKYKKICTLCKNFCFVTNPVLSDNIWKDIIPSENSLDYLRKMLLRESIFGLTQADFGFVEDFTSYLIEEFKKNPAYPHDLLCTFQHIMQWFLSHAEEQRFVFIEKKSFCMHDGRRDISHVLEAIQIKANQVNEKFLLPTDYEKYNLLDKPIIATKEGWILLPKSIMGFSWYEAMLTLFRPLIKQLDEKVGKLMESYVTIKFQSLGIPLYTGKYEYVGADGKKKKGECDHMIVTPHDIILIEDKRKAVTRATKSGNRDQALIDIMFSLVASQHQSLRTSSCLLKDGKIELDDEGSITEVTYDNQEFEHISLDLFDFGPITSRIFVDKVLEQIYHSHYVVDPTVPLSVEDRIEAEKKIHKCNQYIDGLTEVAKVHYDSLTDSKKKKGFRLFFDSWFITLEQLVFLINQSSDTSSFIENLRKLKYVTTGTGEFYNEWYNCINIGT